MTGVIESVSTGVPAAFGTPPELGCAVDVGVSHRVSCPVTG